MHFLCQDTTLKKKLSIEKLNLIWNKQTTFITHWFKTLIKIKFSMTYVYKEYEGKIKMVQDQWLQLKMMFLLGYNMKIVI